MRTALVASVALSAAMLPTAPQANEKGVASHYSKLSVTASGRAYKATDMVAAHPSLPFGTKVKVRNMRNGRTVVVTIVDRGPFIKGRIIDLSKGAASALGFSGVQRVHVTRTGK